MLATVADVGEIRKGLPEHRTSEAAYKGEGGKGTVEEEILRKGMGGGIWRWVGVWGVRRRQW
jgi:hypothetical protein